MADDPADDPLLENPDLVPLRAVNAAGRLAYLEAWVARAMVLQLDLLLLLQPYMPSLDGLLAAPGLREAKRLRLLQELSQELHRAEARLDEAVVAGEPWKALVLDSMRLAEAVEEESFLRAMAQVLCGVAVGELDPAAARPALEGLARQGGQRLD